MRAVAYHRLIAPPAHAICSDPAEERGLLHQRHLIHEKGALELLPLDALVAVLVEPLDDPLDHLAERRRAGESRIRLEKYRLDLLGVERAARVGVCSVERGLERRVVKCLDTEQAERIL